MASKTVQSTDSKNRTSVQSAVRSPAPSYYLEQISKEFTTFSAYYNTTLNICQFCSFYWQNPSWWDSGRQLIEMLSMQTKLQDMYRNQWEATFKAPIILSQFFQILIIPNSQLLDMIVIKQRATPFLHTFFFSSYASRKIPPSCWPSFCLRSI